MRFSEDFAVTQLLQPRVDIAAEGKDEQDLWSGKQRSHELSAAFVKS